MPAQTVTKNFKGMTDVAEIAARVEQTFDQIMDLFNRQLDVQNNKLQSLQKQLDDLILLSQTIPRYIGIISSPDADPITSALLPQNTWAFSLRTPSGNRRIVYNHAGTMYRSPLFELIP